MRNKRASVLFLSACLFALGTAVIGCKGGDRQESIGNAEKIKICVGGAPGIPAWLAQEKGLFAKRGVDVEIVKTPAGPVGFDKMLSGECEMALTSETAVVLNSFKRQDFRILAALATSEDSPRILADRKSGIRNAGDLKGKRIMVYKGSANHFFLDIYLAKNRLSASDVKIIFAETSDDVSEAFIKKKIDAFCASEVLVNKPLKTLGSDAIILNSPGLCYVFFHISATDRFIKERPGTVKKVLAALTDNEMLVHKDPESAILSASKLLKIETGDMKEIWNNYAWRVTLSQPMILALEHEAHWAIQRRLTEKKTVPNYLNFVHPEILRTLRPDAVTLVY